MKTQIQEITLLTQTLAIFPYFFIKKTIIIFHHHHLNDPTHPSPTLSPLRTTLPNPSFCGNPCVMKMIIFADILVTKTKTILFAVISMTKKDERHYFTNFFIILLILFLSQFFIILLPQPKATAPVNQNF